MFSQDDEPESPVETESLMMLTDPSGQPTKSRTLAEKMESTKVQLKSVMYVSFCLCLPSGKPSCSSDAQRALHLPLSADAVREMEGRHKGMIACAWLHCSRNAALRAQIEEALADINATFLAEDILDPVEQIRACLPR